MVYAHYSTFDSPDNITSLRLATDGGVLPWNEDPITLADNPFEAQIPLQANHSLAIYNNTLPTGHVQVYCGYLLDNGTLITNRLPIDIIVENIPAAVEIVEEVKEVEPQLKIDITVPMYNQETEGRLVATKSLLWRNGTTLKVGFSFSAVDNLGVNHTIGYNELAANTPEPCRTVFPSAAIYSCLIKNVIDFASEWSKFGNIYFEEAPWDQSDIRVTFFEGGAYSRGIGTEIRKVAKNEPTMNLELSFLDGLDEKNNPFPNEFRANVIHEFGHVIGLNHEHNSPTVAYYWQEQQIINQLAAPPYKWDEQKTRLNIIDSLLKNKSRSAYFTTEFDPKSIMIYQILATWVSAEDLADPQKCPDFNINPGLCVAFNTDLSAKDKEGISSIYPKGALEPCSYDYNPNEYDPGIPGNININNPNSSAITVWLYPPNQTPTFWSIPANTNAKLSWSDLTFVVGYKNWGIQVENPLTGNTSLICPLIAVSNWHLSSALGYFETFLTSIPGQ